MFKSYVLYDGCQCKFDHEGEPLRAADGSLPRIQELLLTGEEAVQVYGDPPGPAGNRSFGTLEEMLDLSR